MFIFVLTSSCTSISKSFLRFSISMNFIYQFTTFWSTNFTCFFSTNSFMRFKINNIIKLRNILVIIPRFLLNIHYLTVRLSTSRWTLLILWFPSLFRVLAADCPILYIFKHCSTLVLGFFTLIITDYVVAIKTLRIFQQLEEFSTCITAWRSCELIVGSLVKNSVSFVYFHREFCK